MADATQNNGFSLPPPKTTDEQPAGIAAQPTASHAIQSIQNSGIVTHSPQPRDYAIAGGVLIVLLIGFFFAKRLYANHLAGKRVSSGSANAAGWWLFILLTALATAVVLSVLDPTKFISVIFMAPLLAISILALILMFVSGRRA